MDVHLRAKFEVSSKVLTSFRRGNFDENEYLSEGKPKPEKKQQKRKNNIFEYINNDAKRSK